MKISHIILVTFFFILLLFSITTYINYRQADLINQNAEKFERSSIIVRHSNRFQRNFLNMVNGLRGYLLTEETFFIQLYDSAILENKQILNELTLLVPDGSDQKVVLDDIRQLQKYWIDEFAMPLLEAKELAQGSKEKRAFNDLYHEKLVNSLDKDVQKSLQQKFSDFTNFEYGVRATDREALSTSVKSTRKISFYLTMISVVLGGCISIFIASYISSRIVAMVKMAKAIADGNYNSLVQDKGHSELSQLSQALNHMASILNANFTLLKRQKDELDQFAHIVSHDLKAPLRGIDNVVTWIEEDHSFDLPAKVNEYLSLIKGRILRAEGLLKGILMYAKAGREAQPKELVDTKELLKEIEVDIANPHHVQLIIHPDLPVLYTERVPLLQVFTNLIVNAFKYHDKEKGFVKVYHQTHGGHFHFFVEDNGPGISPSYHQKIFVIFQTLQERDTMETVGVGLSIVKKILDDRNLDIKISSDTGKGTTLSFTWPQQRQP